MATASPDRDRVLADPMMYSLLRRALFASPPEVAHDLALDGLKLGSFFGLNKLLYRQPAELPVNLLGLEFPNPVGLAAGLDKNGDFIDALGSLGFGFIEIGTVTPRAQPGNQKPRVFRLPGAQALINRLGFNNKGVDHLVRQAKKRRYRGILGINIGINHDTPNEHAVDDYQYCLERVYNHADYITINISSPNTAGLRDLQSEDALDALLTALLERRDQLANDSGTRVPLLIKIAPDLEERSISAMAGIFNSHGIDGLIATNSTVSRTAVAGMQHASEAGGLSGAPLLELANKTQSSFCRKLDIGIPVIGVGGICKPEDAAGKFDLGASLVQFHTGFIYAGPQLISGSVTALRPYFADNDR